MVTSNCLGHIWMFGRKLNLTGLLYRNMWGPCEMTSSLYCVVITCVVLKRFALVSIAKDLLKHDDVIKWKHFPRYWPFVRRIHRSPVNSPQKGQWRGVLVFSLICIWINGWIDNREAGDSRRHRAKYDVTVMNTRYGWDVISIWSIYWSPLIDDIMAKTQCI